MDEPKRVNVVNWNDLVNTVLKYTAGSVILGSMFYLTYMGKIHVEVYTIYASSVLTTLGVHGLLKKSKDDQS